MKVKYKGISGELLALYPESYLAIDVINKRPLCKYTLVMFPDSDEIQAEFCDISYSEIELYESESNFDRLLHSGFSEEAISNLIRLNKETGGIFNKFFEEMKK